MSPSRQVIFELLSAEREQQIKVFGVQYHPSDKWILILMEEIGELCQELLYQRSWSARVELIQAGAVIVAWLEDYAL